MRLTPINMAEAIFEPFWDNSLSELTQWHVTPAPQNGLSVSQNWCNVTFEWASAPADAPVLQMHRCYDGLDCSEYDRLIISIMAPIKSVLNIEIETEAETIKWQSPPSPGHKKEYAVELCGARTIKRLGLSITAASSGIANGWFNWIGLENSEQLKRYMMQFNRFDEEWEGYLKPESYEPEFRPANGLLMNEEEIAQLRVDLLEYEANHGPSPMTKAGLAAAELKPEHMIRDFVNFWTDDRYCRERDKANRLLVHGPNAALAGLIHRDKHLLRLAARYAMSIAMSENWDDGFICRFPGGLFEHRCFVQSLCSHEAALILDLAGEMFTDAGRNFIMRRLAEEGFASITYNTWRHDYIFACNQLAWFSPGRILALLLLEKHMLRAAQYTDIAMKELEESLDLAILPDGGYVEGPTYFTCVGRSGGLPAYYYSRARNLDLATITPDSLRRTADFAEAIASTDDAYDVISICDARQHLDLDTLAMMAAVLPNSFWPAMCRKVLDRIGFPNTAFSYALTRDIPPGRLPRPFIALPVMGVVTSTRTLGDLPVKILLMGNHAGAGHTHEDKGSFVLEFAGQTFACDPGTADYGRPISGLLKHCQSHNMLVPTGLTTRPHPRCPLPVDLKAAASGDEQRFSATIDATPGWEGTYRRWHRTWTSPSPDLLVINDDYELEQGDGIEFLWQTRLPVNVSGSEITISGEKGSATITAPHDCSISVQHFDADGSKSAQPAEGGLTTIAIRKQGEKGQLEVTCKLYPSSH